MSRHSSFSVQEKSAVEEIVGYRFENEGYLLRALTAKGCEFAPHGTNDRLAVPGATVLNLVIVDTAHDTGLGKELMDRERQKWASKSFIARQGFARGLDKYLRISQSCQGHCSSDQMATAVEALIAAIWLDSGKKLETVCASAQRMGIPLADRNPDLTQRLDALEY